MCRVVKDQTTRKSLGGYSTGGGCGQKGWLKGAEKQEPLGDPSWDPSTAFPLHPVPVELLAPFLLHSLFNPPNAQIPVFHKGKQQVVYLREEFPKKMQDEKNPSLLCFSEHITHPMSPAPKPGFQRPLKEKYIVDCGVWENN